MYFLSYVLAALLVMGGTTATILAESQSSAQASSQEVSAASMRVMAGIAQSFMAAHSAKEGEISASELAPYTPSWFLGDSRVRVIGHSGRAYVFIAPENGNRISVDDVIAGGDAPATLGIASAGKLMGSLSGTVLLDIPAAIPDGSLVYVM
ncbi:type IV pilus biogenesis protein PilM [Bordetella flabilis]|uniref:PilM protein n=1 Tax=Bordetella flabilis TaxID=463014 RepID=A0A193GMU4_9BORD|nr:type IV pilus biogenesis protein PilM [Bordetella flabilis]ANN80801.1 hypothetical protein BAU07_26080 [Bordetella flabilis]